MRDTAKGVLLGVFLLAFVGALATRAGWIVTSLPRPHGTGAWMLSRTTGLLAYVALSLDAIAGLLVSTRSGDRWMPRGQLVDIHGWLSPLALALVLAHGLVLLADGYARFDILDVTVPFASSHRRFAVGVGVVAGYLVLVVHLSFGLRKRIGTATWRRLHYLSFAAFVLVTLHAMAAGSDRAHPWFASVYAVLLLGVAVLVVRRLTGARAATPRAPRGPTTDTR